MRWSKFALGAMVALTTATCLGLPQAEAIEIFSAGRPAASLNHGLVSTVAVYRGYHGAVHHRPGYHPGYRPVHPGYRPGYPAYRTAVWVRPARYTWPAGGALAAGAAIGFVSAAAVAASVGRPPQPGLCWYYTDPSQQKGFWDTCP
jgi:hypothetical protein